MSMVSFDTQINFDEFAFPSSNTSITGTTGYNVIDDGAGDLLTSENGDLPDIFVSTSSIGGGSFQYRTTSLGSFQSSASYSGAPAVNNPGTRIINELGLSFADHLLVDEFSFDVSSTNTAGLSWEVTIFELLDANGNPFSATPVIDPYLGHTEINGLAGLGTYVLDSKATVVGVGSDQVSTGSSNPNQNFTATGDLEFSDFGLATGTMISGIRITTILEDTRGVNNADSSLSASLIDFSFAGMIIPEPSIVTVSVLAFALMTLKRKRF